MRLIIGTGIAFVLLIGATGAIAQSQRIEPKAVKTVRLSEKPPTYQLFDVTEDGTVRIDWDVVETLVSSKADRLALPTAQMMIAIRDKTWRPLQGGRQ